MLCYRCGSVYVDVVMNVVSSMRNVSGMKNVRMSLLIMRLFLVDDVI